MNSTGCRTCRDRHYAWSFVLALMLVAMAGIRCAVAQDLAALEKLLHAAGYQLYNPARADWGPGFVFAGDVVNGRISNVEEICPNLYSNMSLKGAAVVLANYKADDSFSFGVALNFLKNILGDKLDIGGMAQDKVDVSWKNMREMSYTHMDQWLETGEPRPVAARCRAAIEDLKLKNRFKDRIFVITRAVAPEALVYDFSRAAHADVNGSANFMRGLDVAVQGKGHITNGTQLVVDQHLFVGYAPPIKIDDWLPSHLVSGEIVQVRGRTSDLIVE